MKRLLTIVTVLLMNTACGQQEAPADASVIASGSAAWEAALNAKDVDALVNIYTSDTRLMPPNSKTALGSDAVREQFGGMIEAGFSVDLTSIDAVVSGDIGYNIGTYVLSMDGETVDVGKFIETWQRGDDGQWRIANDVWNSDNPMAVTGEEAPMMPMSHVMISHEVEDAERWLAAWQGEDSRHKLFKENGAKHIHTMQGARNPNLTGLIIAVSDMDALNAMLGSEQGMAAAAEDGVIVDTMVILTDAE